MTFAAPIPGYVIRYSYLWHSEFLAGREEGTKDRPCAVVLMNQTDDGRKTVTVLPITHTQPKDMTRAVEILQPVKRRLKLDGDRSWIVFSEANRFKWPGPDLRPVPVASSSTILYGPLPPAFFHDVLARFIDALESKKSRTVPRTQ